MRRFGYQAHHDGPWQPAVNEVWTPRADGKFLLEDPQQLVLQGSIAKVPFVTGVSDDSGSLRACSNIGHPLGLR